MAKTTIEVFEREGWAMHPCTKELVKELQSSQVEIVEAWVNGLYKNDDRLGIAAQANVQLLTSIVEQIKSLYKEDKEESFE